MKQKTVILGFLLALSLILSYVESLLPLAIGIPGIFIRRQGSICGQSAAHSAFRSSVRKSVCDSLCVYGRGMQFYRNVPVEKGGTFFDDRRQHRRRRFSQYRTDAHGRFRRGNFCTGVLSAVSVDCRSCHRIFHRPYWQPRAAITQQNSKEWRNHINVRLFKRYDRRDYGR